MAEEQEQGGGFFSNLKNQIITGAGALMATLGTVFIDEIKSLVGIEPETEQAAPAQQQSNNQSVIINMPEQQPVKETVIVKEKAAPAQAAPAPAPKKKDSFTEEEPLW